MTFSLAAARRAALATLVCATFGFGQAATATTPMASGRAFDLNIQVNVLGKTLLAVTPQHEVKFNDLTLAFNDSKLAPSLVLGDTTTVYLSTDELSAETQWLPGDFFALGSRASVADINLAALDPMNLLPHSNSLLDLSATQIEATAAIVGTCPSKVTYQSAHSSQTGASTQDVGDIIGDLLFTGHFEQQTLSVLNTTSTPDLQLVVGGQTLADLPSDPTANTSINIANIGTLLLNKQTTVGDGINSLSTTVDGLLLDAHVNVVGIKLLDATVNIAHSEASVVCN